MGSIEIVCLSGFTVLMAVLALESERIINGILYLASSSVGIGCIFFYLGANYAAILEFLLYVGILIILFIVTAGLTEGEEE